MRLPWEFAGSGCVGTNFYAKLNQPTAPVNGGNLKFTRDRYQHGSLRRVPRSKGPDVWEFRYSAYEDGVRKQKQLTLSSKKYPTEAAVKRKVEGLLLKVNADSSSSAIQEPTLEAVMEVFTREELPERLKSQQNYRLMMDRHIRPTWGPYPLSTIRPFEATVYGSRKSGER